MEDKITNQEIYELLLKMNDRLNVIEDDVKELKEDLSEVKFDIKELKSSQATIKQFMIRADNTFRKAEVSYEFIQKLKQIAMEC